MNALFLSVFLCLFGTGLKAETLLAVADPWSPYVTPEREDQGLAARTIREALKRQGFDLEIRFMPWARALQMVKNGNADLLVAAWHTEERATYLHFSNPYAENKLKIIKRKEDPFEFNTLESLRGKRIGIVRDYGYDDAFEQDDDIFKQENSHFLANIRMLLAGRIDLTLEDEQVAINTLSKEAPLLLAQIEFCLPPLVAKKLYAATGLNHPRHDQIITAINDGLATMKADGSLESFLH